MSTQATIIAIAQEIHGKLWKSASNVSKQTRSSSEVCKVWQQVAQDELGERVQAEYAAVENGNEKIDLLDVQARVAYELKVSENNPHHEFYRDIFKVIIHNKFHPRNKIRKLVFITPAEGARKLYPDFVKSVQEITKIKHGIEVEICPISARATKLKSNHAS